MATTVHVPARGGTLPRYSTSGLFVLSWAITAGVFALVWAGNPTGGFNIVGTVVVGTLLWAVAVWAIAYLVEGSRKATDRFVTTLVLAAFGLALIPLASLLFTTISNGLARLDVAFFTESMRNVIGAGGGALHAIVGTALITLVATVISVPIGLMTAVYLVEYGRGNAMARAITFLVDVMTGIPSIVAGLFAFAFFSLILNDPGIRFGLGGGVALSILMIPTVVRSSEEMLRLVPNELREAAYALGVPKWLTVTKVVLPTALAGIVTGVMLGIARVAGETAPLLLIAGFTTSMNYNIFADRMMTLPVFVYYQYAVPGINVQASLDRAWTGALVLILLVMVLNLGARLIARLFSPKLSR